MSLPVQVFESISADRFEQIKQQVQSGLGIAITTDSGIASEQGFTIEWTYDRSAQKLSIQCTQKPLLIPAGMVQNKIEQLVEG